MRDVADAEPELRARSWWDRLQHGGAERLAAQSLYAGVHWTTVRRLPGAIPPQHRVVPWVASAGYGLVGWSAELVAYSATFASNQPDSTDRSVPAGMTRSSVLGRWWETLSTFPGPQPGVPRTIEAIAAADPLATILVVASPPYIRAMEADLCKARDLLHEDQQLVLISNGAKLGRGPLAANLVPVDCSVRTIVHSNMVALNANVALELLLRLGSARPDAPTLQRIYAAMTRDAAS